MRKRGLPDLGSALVTAKGEPCKVNAKQLEAEPDYDELVAEFADWLVELADAGLRRRAGADPGRRPSRRPGLRPRLCPGQARAGRRRFRRSDRLDPPAVRAAGHGRMGPLQARPAHRPYPGRRGAGHQSPTNGRSSTRSPTNFLRASRSRGRAGGPCSWSATTSRRSSASRAPTRRNSSSSATGSSARRRSAASLPTKPTMRASAREFRDLSIDASFRSAPAVLEVVDALIGEVGLTRNGARASRPIAHRPITPTGRAGSSCGRAFDPETRRRRVDEGEEGWIDEPDRLYADAHRQAGQALARRSAGHGHHRPAAAPGDILILVRSRAELASLIVARLYAQGVPVAGIDRLHLHKPLAVKDLLAGDRLRGPAARRPQSRRPAGFAADRLEPGAALRARLRPRSGKLWTALRERAARSSRTGRGARHPVAAGWRWPTMSPRRASSKRSCPGRSTAGASCFGGWARRRATRSRSWSQRAGVRAGGNRLARPLPRLVRPGRGRGQARPVRADERGSGDDRPWRQGAGSAAGDPRRRDRMTRTRSAGRRRSIDVADAAASARCR